MNTCCTVIAVAWNPNAEEPNRWIQAEFSAMCVLYSITTQGSSDYDNFVASYYVSYGNDGSTWQDIATQYFAHMEHHHAKVTNQLPRSTYGRFVRLYLDTIRTYGTVRWGVNGGKQVICRPLHS